ncbi:MAG: tRNA (adenosine(37)-N6)-threonylcarbamoyltransferase complex ATPase subunit type 1 TsaE [Desulfomonile tiedjei]|nr:tRNA (adenosine(37)-N6)-threonylcarbamoyltransferase complex ATPase subunit type 1 TsaE [Desulfomonile tiedjei]
MMSLMRRYIETQTRSEQETVSLGRALGQMLQAGDVIYLIGDLGSGKTRLAKGIVSAAAGVDPDDVVSPTFTLVNSYQGERLVSHADLYRLDAGGIDDIGLDDTIEAGGALIIEWAERMPEFASDPLVVTITSCGDENCRKFLIEWTADGTWNERLTTWLALSETDFAASLTDRSGCSEKPTSHCVGE